MQRNFQVMIVDDEPRILRALNRTLSSVPGITVVTATGGKEALAKFKESPADIVISDLSMPEMSGNDLLEEITSIAPETIRIMLTAHKEPEHIMAAVNRGRVSGYINKPWSDDELRAMVEDLVASREQYVKRSIVGKVLGTAAAPFKKSFEDFVGNSPSMQRVYNKLEKAAPSKASVFITGESGTGKEVAAFAIHNLSQRKNDAFIALNCAAIPSELMESEIFGHVKGAFSGAVSNRDGAATLADNGTLFLDELGEMDMALQAKILRFIQTGTFQRVGGTKTEKVNVRFVAATNREPHEAIQEGRLREDLFYRLNVIAIDMPSLKDRENDVVLLARHFLTCFSEDEEKPFVGFSDDAEAMLKRYSWPGNVRQLQNLIHSCVVMNDGPVISAEMLADHLTSSELMASGIAPSQQTVSVDSESISTSPAPVVSQNQSTVEPLALMERKAIQQAIALYDDNVVKAASALEVSPSTLYRKMQQWEE